jgi:hypothetical protein
MMLTLFIDGLEVLAVPAPWRGECDKNIFCLVQGNIIKVMDIKDQGFRGRWGLDVRFHTRLRSDAEKNTLARRGHTNMVNAQRCKCVEVSAAFIRLDVAFLVKPLQSYIQILRILFVEISYVDTHWGIQ